MAKRKRALERPIATTSTNGNSNVKIAKTNGHVDVKTLEPVVQIVAGSYERILHGITASVTDFGAPKPATEFADTFLFNAHASAIRCLALSPLPEDGASDTRGVFLATGGSDERVNVYSLSASPMPTDSKLPAMPTLGNNKVSENPGNRELGTLMQHSSNISALHFPTRSKLLSASEDNTVSIARLRDLTVVSTIKAPRPKVQGQPSGDTAPPGATPAGVNDFAIHPSMKLMISVGRGERAMRLWNLVTGKKAGVLNFDRSILQSVKEGKHSSGEGRRIRWNTAGTEFAVAFERGIAVFGEDSRPRSIALPLPLTKVHQIAYANIDNDKSCLVVSTEDGRLVFFDTNPKSGHKDSVPMAEIVGQIGGRAAQVNGRTKDFKILRVDKTDSDEITFLVVTASSDGVVRLWKAAGSEFRTKTSDSTPRQVGSLIGMYETGNRITCLDAYIMLPATTDEGGYSEFEGVTDAEESSSDSDDSQ